MTGSGVFARRGSGSSAADTGNGRDREQHVHRMLEFSMCDEEDGAAPQQNRWGSYQPGQRLGAGERGGGVWKSPECDGGAAAASASAAPLRGGKRDAMHALSVNSRPPRHQVATATPAQRSAAHAPRTPANASPISPLRTRGSSQQPRGQHRTEPATQQRSAKQPASATKGQWRRDSVSPEQLAARTQGKGAARVGIWRQSSKERATAATASTAAANPPRAGVRDPERPPVTPVSLVGSEADDGDGSFFSDAFQMTDERGEGDVGVADEPCRGLDSVRALMEQSVGSAGGGAKAHRQQQQQQQQQQHRQPSREAVRKQSDFLHPSSKAAAYGEYFGRDPLSPLQRERAARKEGVRGAAAPPQQQQHHRRGCSPGGAPSTGSPVRRSPPRMYSGTVFASPPRRPAGRLSPRKHRVVVLPSGSPSPEPQQQPHHHHHHHPEQLSPEGQEPSPSPQPQHMSPSPEGGGGGGVGVGGLHVELDEALLRNDTLTDENDRLLAWNQELQDELVALSDELQRKCDQSRQVERLEAKLRDKADACEKLRGRVKDMSDRVRLGSLSSEPCREGSPSESAVIADLSEHIARIEREKAEMELLYNERESELHSLREAAADSRAENEQGKVRTAALEAQVAELAAGFEEVQRRQEELCASDTHLREALRDSSLEAEDARDTARRVEDQLKAELRTLDRQLADVRTESDDWERRYRELRSSYNMLASAGSGDVHGIHEGPGEPHDHHACHESLAECISDTIYLQQVVRSYSTSPNGVDPALRVGNDEPLPERRRRLFGLSLADACATSADHTKTLYGLMLDTLALQGERGGGHGEGGGCDVQ